MRTLFADSRRKACRSANHRLELLEKLALRHRKSMQRFVTAGSLIDLPLGEPKGNIGGQHLNRNVKPLRCDDTQPRIEISDDSIEIHTQYKFRVTQSSGLRHSAPVEAHASSDNR